MANDWRFECYEEPATDGGCIQGVARLGKKRTMFCVAGDISVVLFLLVEPTRIGLDLVRGFEQKFGPSTLLYMLECNGVKGYMAEWHFHGDNEALNHRIDELRQGKISSQLSGRVTFLHRNSNYVI